MSTLHLLSMPIGSSVLGAITNGDPSETFQWAYISKYTDDRIEGEVIHRVTKERHYMMAIKLISSVDLTSLEGSFNLATRLQSILLEMRMYTKLNGLKLLRPFQVIRHESILYVR